MFEGVYPADHIPPSLTHRKRDFCIIVNLSELNFPGTHFVAIMKKKNSVLYFDSAGMPCFIPEICKFIATFKLPIKSLHKKLQSDQSVYCAFYTILFCLVHEGISKYVFHTVKKELHKNDQLVVSYVVNAVKRMK